MSYKGKFIPLNYLKYKGDHLNIVYRSLWELKLMKFFDENDSILEWSSEEIIIPYISPKDKKYHRYYPDFKIKKKTKDNIIETVLIEVKPKKQTKAPKIQNKKTKKYLNEVLTYAINKSKWEYAEKFCDKNNWKFQIITEDDLGIKY